MRAVLYLRVSLDATGHQLAVTRQREDCQRIAQQRGLEVVREYVDNSISASDAKKLRPAYRQMVEDYSRGAFEALICYDLDRLTRQPRELEDWIDAATDRGLVLLTANGEADLSTDGGRMYARIKSSVARAEIERKSARQRRAALQRSELGKPPMGVRLTGYTVKGEVIEAEAQIVRQMFARFAEGDSLRSLVAWLQESGIKTRHGAAWNPSTVRTVLTNPRYAGRAIYQGKVTGKAGSWQPLVDGDTFDLVQARLSDPRRRTQTGTDRKHLGSGLFRCAVCDSPVQAWSGNRYRCKLGCVNRAQSHIDALITGLIHARLSSPDLASLLDHEPDESMTQQLGQLQTLRTRLRVISEDYDAGHIDGQRYAMATEKVTAELVKVQTALAHMGTSSLQLLRSDNPAEAFAQAPLMLKRAAINALCTVRLRPAPRGRKTFDPQSVEVSWRRGESPAALASVPQSA